MLGREYRGRGVRDARDVSVAVLGVAVFTGCGDEFELGGECARVGLVGGEEAFEDAGVSVGVLEEWGHVGGVARGVVWFEEVAVEVGEAAGF